MLLPLGSALLLIGSSTLPGGQDDQDRRQVPARPSVEALHSLVHAGRIDEMMAKADSLRPDDPAWKKLMEVLLEAAEQRNDYSYLKRKAKEVFTASRDPETRSLTAFSLGVGYWKSGQFKEATAAFTEVIKAVPGGELTKRAEGNIHEIANLRIGQPVPHFAARTTVGAQLNSGDLRGKVVLLNFWASW